MPEYTALALSFLLLLYSTAAFIINPSYQRSKNSHHTTQFRPLCMGSSDYAVELTKPLGIVLEECDEEGNGVLIKSLVDGGAASESGAIVPGEVLLKIGTKDVSTAGFDDVMDLLASAPSDKPLSLTLGDGLGRMDIAPNLAKQLSPDEAIFADAVVRAAVREIRKNGSLGDLLKVEIVLGAGVRNDGRCLVRFFAILSTDGVTTYSCNISATGKREEDGVIDIIALSCAKDEGWGQTVDLIP
uniref:PDZ domain-containing protein n=1 Tax=Helicotheca tamesis TaxID=374047 RepID=A0A7S2H820_9STRA